MMKAIAVFLILVGMIVAYHYLTKICNAVIKRCYEIAVQRSYARGYDYAVRSLDSGTKTPAQLEMQYLTGDTFGEGRLSKAFDRGMREAVNNILLLGYVTDDRIL